MDGDLIRELRRRLGLTQRQLAERMHVDQGTISRWERGIESPRPARRAALNDLLLQDESRRAMQRSLAIVRQDYMTSTLLDSKLRMVEMSATAERHFRSRGYDPKRLYGMSVEEIAERLGMEGFYKTLSQSGLLEGDALLFRFVRNNRGRGHATVYEPIFEDGRLVGILNYITRYFDFDADAVDTIELIEAVRTGDPTRAEILHRGPNADEALRLVRSV